MPARMVVYFMKKSPSAENRPIAASTPSPSDTLNLTLGPAESKVVARGDGFVATSVMPLFVRADPRVVDAYQLGRFVAMVRDLLNHPERLDAGAE